MHLRNQVDVHCKITKLYGFLSPGKRGLMGFHLGVWYSARAISNQEAAELFRLLSEQRWVPLEQYVSVYSFYNDLTSVFPEIEMTPEEKLEDCPWSCAMDHSGLHVLMDIEHEKARVILPLVLGLAQKHGWSVSTRSITRFTFRPSCRLTFR